MSQELINKATEYLANGGLFNPESMEHEKVRDLIYQMRNEIASLKKELTNEKDAHEAQIERMTSESFDDGETFK